MKNYFLKSKLLLTLIFSLFVCIPFGLSQNENPNKKKPFYTVEANFGVSTCKEMEYGIDYYRIYLKEDARLAYQTLVYGTNFAAGIELVHYFKVGLGLGYLYYKQKNNAIPYSYYILPDSKTTHGIPLFIYLRSDFLNRKTSPYIDFKIGNNFLITKEGVELRSHEGFLLSSEYGKFKLKNGLFLASNIGVAYKSLSKTILNFSVGYRYISREHDFLYDIRMYAGTDVYRKTGYIMADHQFVVSLGLSF